MTFVGYTYVQSEQTGTWHVLQSLNWPVATARCGRLFAPLATQDEEPTTTYCAECWQAKWRTEHPLATEEDD